MAGFSIIVFMVLFIIFLAVEAISLGFLISGIVVAIYFATIKNKQSKKIGNKVAIPICLITLGITGILPAIYIILVNIL